ncbi:hypothetical protein [Pedosphaera parvula]|uniref:Delta-60 repeat protein n=1 Tax=Pedosphaera parvula (strain Ellin514) TaxID=320771 RepID=B9XJR8_PEDPL|nr:hypothetical protein [Pedosphaera parvula]EEF59944.1 conserved hypothetical protein [Pedosphaera parvula Ellin514]
MKVKLASKKPTLFLLLTFSIFFSEFFSAHAAPGILDTTFNKTGKVRTGFGGGNAQGYAMAVQPDGKLILGGVANKDYPGVGGAFVLARFDTNNVLDSSFGSSGSVITPVGVPTNTYYSAAATAIKVQANGKIVAGGFANIGTTYPDFTIIRYNSDGSLDTTFGTNGTGIVSKDLGQAAKITSMGIQQDGKIVVGGYLLPSLGSSGGVGAVVARYQTNGVLDTSFGNNGIALVAASGKNDAVYGLLLLGTGNILGVGSATRSGDNGIDFAVYRFTTNGVLDTAFGGTGRVLTKTTTTTVSYIDEAQAVGYQLGNFTVQNPDKLVVVGYHWDFSGNNHVYQTIVRYLLDGSLDTSFGSGGVTTNIIASVPGFGDYGVGVVVQGDLSQPRKIVVAGYANASSGDYFTLARYTAAGAFDTTFNGTGKLVIPTGPGAYDVAAAFGLQAGQYVVAGTREINGHNSVMMAARVTSTGILDTNFGTGGIITADVSDIGSRAKALAVQADGKIIAAGSGNNGVQNFMALARYQTNGLLDPSFGAGGRVIALGSNDVASAVTIQPDGKIVAGGSTSSQSFALARFQTNGLPDPSFGTGGRIVTSFSGTSEVLSLLSQPDGKIIAAGDASDTSGYATFALARYNTNGTLDATFGSGGKVTTGFTSPSINEAYAMRLQPDGKYLLGGFTEFVVGSGVEEDFAMARYNTNGALDFSFGSLGRVSATVAAGTLDIGYSMALQPDGKILMAGGAALGGNSYVAIARFNTNGTVDNSFGSGGSVINQVGAAADYATALTLQPDGKIVIAGSSQNVNFKFFAQRYNSDGSIDGSFGTGGTTLIDFGTGTNEYAYALTLDASGRPVIAGDAGGSFGVARLGRNPELTIAVTSTNTVLVSWPLPLTGWNLQQKSNLNLASWSTPTETVHNDGTNNFIIVSPPTGTRFYRLIYP